MSRTRRVSLADLAVIMLHVYKANQLPEHGHVDADRSLTELLNDLTSFAHVKESALESGLFYCSTLEERELFRDPRGTSLDVMLRRIGKFNRDYHWFENEDQKPETD